MDPFAENEPRMSPTVHVIGQDLSLLSVEELGERIAMLQAEVERLETSRAAKEATRKAADSFFRL